MTPPAARLFRLLGLHPGPDFAVRAVASLAGVPLGQCRILLAELVDAHLVEERVLDRYAVHDLIRAYAVEMVRAHDTDRDRREAELRLLDHYLHTAYAASRLLYQHEEPIPVGAARDGVVPVPCRDYGEAMAWFTAERAVLLSMVAFAARPDFADYPWQLAWSLVEFLDRQGHWQDWVTSHRTALSAADRLDNPQAQARTRLFLARAYNRLGFSAQAEVELDVALRLYRTTGSTTGEATTHLALSASAERRSDLHGSLAHDRAAYELFRRAGHLAGQAEALNACGWDLVQLGDYQHAVEHCEQALQLCQHLDEPHGAAATWDTLGYAHFHLGDHRRAIACYEQALRLYRQLDDRYNIGDVLVHLGEARHQDGQIDAARIAWNEALALLETLRPSAADDVRIKLKAVQHD